MSSTVQLVAAAQKGDQEAFAELVRRYQRVTITTAWAVLHDFHAAQDVAQESFVMAFRKLSTLRHPKAFGPWLLKLTHRAAVQHSAQCPVTVPLESVAESVAMNEENGWPERFADVALQIGSLPDAEREVIVFRYVDGLSVNEIAEMTSSPIGSITKRISRALSRLRDVVARSEI